MLHLNQFALKGCPKCGGDLAMDQGDWLCLNCGSYYYSKLYRNIVTSEPRKEFPALADDGENDTKAWALGPETSFRSWTETRGNGPAISGLPGPGTSWVIGLSLPGTAVSW